MKPIVNIIKNNIIDQKPNQEIELREIIHGNKKLISKSNIKNKMATR